ncbi:holo-ACP synthase [Paenibacillus yanchengensis]|uniref:Holo-[acyl-carrier-protein] synthase n=1 Tax=Paenibacillus yanchengensis TaxID=2035833 RepID=A0ABW4YIE2_9BACL
MIIGIGHDLIRVERVAAILSGKNGSRFLERILVSAELQMAKQYSNGRLHQFVAGRFAAKEAVSKAFGTGIGAALAFSDISIERDRLGKPFCHLTERAWHSLGMEPSATRIHLTITHEDHLASAFAIVEQQP